MSEKVEQLKILQEKITHCSACPLSSTRHHLVFGEGNPESPVVFTGEAPGKEEDLQGRPFVGRSGRLLEEMIFEVMGFQRNEVYITNIVKCRPTVDLKMEKDRPPERHELEHCRPFLIEQLEILKPRVIVTLGASSTRGLLGKTEGITKIRGNWHTFSQFDLMPTFHPSYVLRNGGKTSQTWETMASDLHLVKQRITTR